MEGGGVHGDAMAFDQDDSRRMVNHLLVMIGIGGNATDLNDASNKLSDALDRILSLENLVIHCWIHSGYPSCGIDQMETSMKEIYTELISSEE